MAKVAKSKMVILASVAKKVKAAEDAIEKRLELPLSEYLTEEEWNAAWDEIDRKEAEEAKKAK